MANHKSAKKRAKQSVVRNQRNKSYISKVRTAVKKFNTSLEELKKGATDVEKTRGFLVSAQSLLQKSAAKGIVHKNNASRKVSRLAQSLASATKGK